MPRFFISREKIKGDTIFIEGGDARHIAGPLRMREGDAIVVCDMQKMEYDCRIERIGAEGIAVRILTSRASDTEPPYRAHLYQALPKADKLDGIVQKAVETGVCSITPFVSERCVARPDAAAVGRRVERWRKIAGEAAKQCGRGIVPRVEPPISYEEAVRMASESAFSFLCYEGDGTVPLSRLLAGRGAPEEGVSFLIGAEGGFSAGEVEMARRAGLALAGLGRRILRCETASSFVLACLAYEYELK